MAKRSPILGYNHNVRYRGLIFHVQTEDSGLLSPHLFTHLFYGGTIISTRKLVYDAGSDEGAIKSLMQAQHKAVLKDLRKGSFDDKIDVYLAGTEGLLPRGAVDTGESEPLRESQPVIPSEIPMPQEVLTEPGIEIIRDEDSQPVALPDQTVPIPVLSGFNATMPLDIIADLEPEPEPPPVVARAATPPPIMPRTMTPQPALSRAATPPPLPPEALRTKTPGPTTILPRKAERPDTEPATPRTKTADRKSGSGRVPPPPRPEEIDPPTIAEDPATLAAQMFASSSTARPFAQESAPEIEIVPEDPPPRRREPHDTNIDMPTLMPIEDAPRVSDGIPSASARGASGRAQTANESIPPLPPPPLEKRAPVNAATLPPSRPITRPPSRAAISTPPVMSRPITAEQERLRPRGDSDAVEVYAPAPPSVEPPPGAVERPGQYAQHRRTSARIGVPEGKPERSGPVPIPAGLGRPQRPQTPSSQSQPIPRPVPREPTPAPPINDISAVPQHVVSAQTMPTRGQPPSQPRPLPGRSPTPQRIQSTQPMPRSAGSGGVVMTRPAVIVGAPAKPTPQRVRKAREEEGRGFGQGLISEKSLDEVILAYLSEDADDK